MNIKKNKNQFIISMIIGVAVITISYQFFSSLEREINDLKKGGPTSVIPAVVYKYVVSKSALTKGTVITEDNIELKQTPAKIEGGFEDPREVLGLVLVQDIEGDRPVTRDFFSPDDLPTTIEPKKGFRAVSIATQNKSYVPPMKPMTLIDLYSTQGSIVAENVRVLDLKKDAKSGKVVVLEIKDDNVSNLVKVIAENKEDFAFVLKNQGDDRTYKFSYAPQLNDFEKLQQTYGYTDLAPPPISSPNVTNYNIEEFVINEAPKKTPTVEVIRGENKTECGF